MEQLNFPAYDFRMSQSEGKTLIFDPLRKKFVALTPEEWVRQHMLSYLLAEKQVPVNLIAVEKQLIINGLVKRFDIAVFERNGTPLMLVECKAPSVEITEKVFDQAARYNRQLKVHYFLLTNGLQHICCKIDYETGSYVFLEEIPVYSGMI